jgi:hypothetical protein
MMRSNAGQRGGVVGNHLRGMFGSRRWGFPICQVSFAPHDWAAPQFVACNSSHHVCGFDGGGE